MKTSTTSTAQTADSKSLSNIRFITITALFIALTYVFTAFINIRLPITANGGLIHLGNVPLFICAIIFGKKSGGWNTLAIAVACVIKVAGYYIAEGIIYGNWIAPVTSIPGNLVQIGVAAVIVLLIVGQLQKIVNKML